MYHTTLKEQILRMNIGDTLRPMKGYKEPTIRNYASILGKELARTYAVKRENTTFQIIRIA